MEAEEHRAVPPFFITMAKKEYQQPSIQITDVRTATILSGSTGATGSDVPWGARRRSFLYDYYEEEEEYDY